jgi:deoxycytidylate deaminase
MAKHNITAILYDKRGRVLSIGKNSYIKTHPMMARASFAVGQPFRVYLHAEIAALIRLKDWDKAYKMVITRFNKLGQPVKAAPCACCQYILKQTSILVEHT